MAQALHRVHYTRAEYVSFERSSNVKHEYLDGVIYAMAGGTPEHAAIAANVIASLIAGLRARPFRVYTSDLRIRVAETGLETYPDVTIVPVPAEVDPTDRHVVTNPIVLVEVTSPSTEEYDRGEKLEHYQRIPSLREVVFVAHRERMVEVIRREDEERWSRHVGRPGDVVRLASVGSDLSVDDVYRGITEGS
jgi:Uma2 family endonuclease